MSLRNFIRHTRLLIEQGLYESRNLNHVGQSRALELTRLEERVLFSASAIAPVVAEIAEFGGDLMNAAATADHSVNNSAFSIADQQLLDLLADSVLPSQTADQNPNASQNSNTGDPAQHTLELVFLDSSINNIEQMKSDLLASGASDSSRTLEFVVLDSTKDGIAQITSALLRYNGIDGMHIVSHGDAGGVQLGSTSLSLGNLYRYSTAINAWQYSMSDQADILFYGCNLAAVADGQQLMNEISALTEADVAASEDLTGSEILGGDWKLEYQVGVLETQVVFTGEFQTRWSGLLDSTAAGGETIVNQTTTNAQATTPGGGGNVAMDADGNYVVAWQDGRSGNNDVWAAVYNADGTVKVSEFKVHSNQSSDQEWANVAMAANGNFAVTWSDARSSTYETYMRLFNSTGTAITGETLVSAMSGSQDWHAVDFAADGSCVIAFQSSSDDDIYFQRYNASGVAQGSSTKVNTYTSGMQIAPDIAVADDGSFIVTWDSTGQDGSGYGIYAQRFNASGVAQGSEFRVNTYTSSDQVISNVAAASDGSFVVSWESNGQDGSGYGIYAQRYNSSGAAQGSEFRVNTFTTGDQRNSHLDMNSAGDFIVTWQSNAQDGSSLGIYSQQFDSAGTRIGGEVLVNTTTTNGQQEPSVAYSGNKAVVVWGGQGTGDMTGVFSQRFTTTNYSTITVDTTSDVSDGTVTSIAALLNNKGADGKISLREAIAAANNSANGTGGADRIVFNIALNDTNHIYYRDNGVAGTFSNPVSTTLADGSITDFDADYLASTARSWYRITLTGSDLNVSQAVIIDGSTQFGYDASMGPIIELNAAGVASGDPNGLTLTTGASTVRGLVINRGGDDAIEIDVNANGSTIAGNYLGTDVSGLQTTFGNRYGITVKSDGNTIGGTTVADRNIISGNTSQTDSYGIGFWQDADNNLVYGNYIGAGANATTAIGNEVGIAFYGTNHWNQIGGTSAGQGNIIANSDHDGVSMGSSSANSNPILGNSIYANADTGIDLGNNGLTFNDITDMDAGANDLVNFAVLKTANSENGDTTITGSFQGFAGATYRVEFFSSAFSQQDNNGYGEAKNYLGFTTITTDGSGHASFSQLLSGVSLTAASIVTSTVTLDYGGGFYGSTSEFSGNILAGNPNLFITGSYVGDGTDNRAILGLGFRPEAIIILPNFNGQAAYVKTSAMAGDTSKAMSGTTALQSNYIQALNGDGFEIGTDNAVNQSGQTYHWVAFGAGSDISVGAYTGNAATQTISGVGFSPEMVWSFNAANQSARWESSLSDHMFDFVSGDYSTAGITSFDADGFTVDSTAAVNGSGNTVYYIAFNQHADYFNLGTYVGSGVDDHNITGVGFEPELVFTRQLIGNNYINLKTESSGYDQQKSGEFGQYGQIYNDSIQALQPDGFQLGTLSELNFSGTDYAYFAFRQTDAPIFVTTTSDVSNGDTSSIVALRANDGGDGISLREAIEAANNTHNGTDIDTILFDIAQSDLNYSAVTNSYTIQLSSVLPWLDDSVIIDATTQAGYDGTPGISLRGNAIGGPDDYAFGSDTAGMTIRGFAIGGFSGGGFYLEGAGRHIIESNYIGTDVTGVVANANGIGIYLNSGADGSRIGGSTAGQGNLISGNTSYGIIIEGTSNTTIQGNFIGTNAAGTAALGNQADGIMLASGASNNLIGGVTAAERNIISGNDNDGIWITLVGTSANTIQGNWIGFGADGSNIGNAYHGIAVENGASSNLIGGTATGAGNRIGNSGWDGISISGATGTGNSLLHNVIVGNTGDAIDLNDDGVTSNDANDVDSGPNSLQNFPVITTAETNEAGAVRVVGSLNTTANTKIMVDVYANSSSARQGERYLGAFGVTTDGSGNASFEKTVYGTLAAGEYVTMTATVDNGDGTFGSTSEFSASRVASGGLMFAATDLSSGIELNTDGGNDSYFYLTDGRPVLGGLNQLTVEASFQVDSVPGGSIPIIDYVEGGIATEFGIAINPDGSLHIVVADGAPRMTTGTYSQLLDGNQHHVAVSWENTNGFVQFYIDGEYAESITGVGMGHALFNGSVTQLVIGQNADDAGDFYSDKVFSGTIYDLRVWNNVRSEAEISLNYQHKFDGGSLPIGLIANWQMDGFNGSNEVVDVVSGNNLSIGHAVGGGFTASTPVDDLHINENATNGTTVGYVVPTDPVVNNDIVSDGGFWKAVEPTGVADTYFANGSGAGSVMGDWTVTEGSVDLFGIDDATSPLGGRIIDLDGNSPGAIRQTLTTEVGRHYQIIFNMGGEYSSDEPIKDIRVSAGGTSQDFSLSQPPNWNWLDKSDFSPLSMTFIADASSTELTFKSLENLASASGAYLADIRVVEIPPAISVILNNDSTLSYDAATGKFYRVSSTATDWIAANSVSQTSLLNGVAGNLVSIRSAYENDLLWNLAQDINADLWIGATDKTSEGNFYWQNSIGDGDQFWSGGAAGSASGYQNWKTGTPRNPGTGEDFVVMESTDGRWSDFGQGMNRRYVTEWDASQVLSNYTFTLTDDAGGRFAINSHTGEITVADGSLLDYESATSHSVTVEVADAAGGSYNEAMTISLGDIEESISNAVPLGQTTAEDTTLVFNTAGGNAISIADDAGTIEQVTITVAHGTLTLSQTTGLTFDSGGDGTASMTIRGTVENINAALEDLQYDPDANYNGSDTLSVSSIDGPLYQLNIDANLVGHYAFDNTAPGDDSSPGGSYDATLVGNASVVKDPTRGDVLSLDGDGDHAVVSSLLGSPANVTLAAWVNLTSTDTSGAQVIAISDKVGLRLDTPSNTMVAYFYNGTGTTSVSFAETVAGTGWRHVALTFNDTINSFTLYLDGVAVASTTTANSINYSGAAVQTRIGSIASNGYDFNGLIDDARVYSRALTAAEIISLVEGDLDQIAITVTASNDAPIAVDDSNGFDVGVLAQNPVGYWRLGESSGSMAVDSSVNGLDGTYNGPTLGTVGVPASGGDTSADFDGINDSVNLGNFDVDGTGLTLSAWINIDDFDTSDQRIISKAESTGSAYAEDHTWMLSTCTSGSDYVLRFRVMAGGTTETLVASTGNLNTNRWYFVAATYDAATDQMKLFIDGVEVGSQTHSVGGAVDKDPTQTVMIGANPNGYAYFDGSIDEVAVFDKALTQAELQTMQAGTSGSYVVNENAALNVAADQGVLANDSDLEGDTLTVSEVNGVGASVGSQITLASGALLTLNADGSFEYDPNGAFVSLTAGASTTDSFDYTVSDSNGGTDTATATITIVGENFAPTIDLDADDSSGSAGASYNTSFTENGGPVAIVDSDATLTDADGTLGSLTVTLNNPLDGAYEVLNANISGTNISMIYNSSTGVLTLSGIDSVVHYLQVLKTVTYNNTSESPDTTLRTFMFVADDGLTTSNVAVTALVMSAVNDAPSLTAGAVDVGGIISVDFGFGDDEAYNSLIQPDGKIILSGFANNGSNIDFGLVRLNTDGTLDTSFGTGGRVITAVGSGNDEGGIGVALQSDGKIVMVGIIEQGADRNVGIVRYNADGSLDTNFGTAGIQITNFAAGEDMVRGVAIQADGKIVATGSSNAGSYDETLVARYLSDGTLDVSFGLSGFTTVDIASEDSEGVSVIAQSDGKIVLSGTGFNGTDRDFLLIRLNFDGTLDTGFDTDGIVTTDFGGGEEGRRMQQQADGKYVVNGYTNSGAGGDFVVARYNTDGSLDTSFGSGGKVVTSITTGADESLGVALQSDGRILVSGYTQDSGRTDFVVVRYNSDGTLDASFANSGIYQASFSGTADMALHVTVQADGRIIASGATHNGTDMDFLVIRLNADGTLDPSFGTAAIAGPPNFVEGGSPVVLDGDIEVFDEELSGINDFGGTTLTIARSGGAQAEDQLVFGGVVTTSGANVSVSGTQVGTYIFTSGQMIVTFDGGATQSQVNTLMQNIRYGNSSDAPPSSVQINWTFNDGNSGAQGSGGAKSATGSTTVNISSVNDAPAIMNGSVYSYTGITEDAISIGVTVTTIVNAAGWADPDTGTVRGMAITGSSGNGTWQYSIDGTTWNTFGSVSGTNALLLGATTQVRYIGDSANGETATFNYRAWDQTNGTASTNATQNYLNPGSGGGTTAFSSQSATGQIVTTSIHDAPGLDAGKSPVLASQNEDSGAPSGVVGTLISSLVDFATPAGQVDNVTDPDSGALLGIAISVVDATNGTWFYSIDGGTNWNAMGSVSNASARLLAADANTRIYFQPNANYNGTLANAITFRAWDQTSGTNGGTAILGTTNTVLDNFSTVSYSNNNGSTSWSGSWVESDSGGTGASVGEIRITGGSLRIRSTVPGDSIRRQVNLNGVASATLTFDFTNSLGSGDVVNLQISSDGGSSYTTLTNFSGSSNTGSGSRSFDISGYAASNTIVRFIVAAQSKDQYLYIDNVQISSDVLTVGGTTAFSTETDTASLIVNAVNDAPVANAGGPYTITEGNTLNLNAAGTTDVDSPTLTYRWDLNNDGNYTDVQSNVATSAVTWSILSSFGLNDNGVYTIGLQVDDGSGGVVTTTTTVTILNAAPILTATGNATTGANAVYTLTLNATDPGNDTISGWTVNWGDGSIGTYSGNPGSVTHTYSNSEVGFTFDITFSATDEDGTYFNSDMWLPAYYGGELDILHGYAGDIRGFYAIGNGLSGHSNVLQAGNGNFLISGFNSSNVGEYQPDGTFVRMFVTTGSGGLSGAAGMAIGSDGNLFISSANNGKVLRFDGTTGAFIDEFISTGLSFALGLTFGPHGNLYVASQSSHGVLKFNGTTGVLDATFNAPSTGTTEDITFGPDGNLYVSSISNGVVRLNGATGAFIDNFVAIGTGGLTTAAGLSFGPDGNLYISDQNANAVRRYDGTTGAYIDDYVTAGGIPGPAYMMFTADQRVTVTDTNQSPTFATNTGATVNEGASVTITTAMLNEGDPDDSGAGLTYTITANGNNGTIKLNGTDVGLNDTFTQQDIDDNLLTYAHSGSETTSDSFSFSLADGGENGSTPATGTFSFTVTPVNDAPMLDNSGTMTLSPVGKDAMTNPGNTIGQIITSAGGNRINDFDTVHSEGVAITATTSVNGTWEYSTNGGGSWNTVGTVAGNSALLLRASDSIRFVPNGTAGVSDSINFRAWDQTTGTAGARVDVTTNGGTTAFSTASETAAVLTVNSTGGPIAIDDNANTTPNTSAIVNVVANDFDPQSDPLTVLDVSNPNNGTVSVAGGVITYTPDGAFSGTDTFQYFVTDGNDGLAHYWKLDSNANDTVGGVSGTLINGPATIEGYYGDALDFDGIDDYARIPDINYTSEFSLSFYFQADTNSGTGLQYFYSHGDVNNGESVFVALVEDNYVIAGQRNTLVTTIRDSTESASGSQYFYDVSGIIGDGLWHSYTMTVTPGIGTRIYLDGALVGTLARGGDPVNPTGDVYLGSKFDLDPTRFLDGKMDSVAIHNRALTAAEIGDRYSSGNSVGVVTIVVNAPPVITPTSGTTTYIENAAPITVDSTLTLIDIDSAQLTGATIQITANFLSGQDSLSFTNQNGIGGTWNAGSGMLTLSGNASVADYQSALRSITYSNSSDDPGISTRTVSFMTTDGIANSNYGFHDVAITAVNDAPVLDNTGNMTFTTVTEDQTSNAGNTISQIIASAGGDRITDVDSGAVEGIAVTSLNSGSGNWQFSTNAGATWSNVGIVSGAQALLLRDTDLLRFVPNTLNGTTASVTFHAWDQTGVTAGQQGTKVDVSVNGGTTAFSAASTTSSIVVTDVNDAPTGSVTIDNNTPAQGDTLTASNTLADADGPGTISYQWKANGTNISGATGTTYVLTEAEVGKTITVVAGYTDGHGTAETVSSTATAAVANVNDAPTGSVTISGAATQNQTLTASNTLADADGLGTISYQWKANGTNISGATGTTYVVTEAEVGKVMTVIASYTDGHGTAETISSAATAAVANVNDAPTGSVTISGAAMQNQTLTASNTLADADGLGAITYTWQANGSTVGTGATYVVTVVEVGKVMTVIASYTDGHGTSESVTSPATAAVSNVNDEEVLTTSIGMTVSEGDLNTVIGQSSLETKDIDNTPDQLVYTLTSLPSTGSLRLNGTLLVNGDTFTQANINARLLTYDHNDAEMFADSFSFTVDDGSGTNTASSFSISITPVNDNIPIITSNGGPADATLNIAENTTAVTVVTATDADLPTQTLTFSIVGGPDAAKFTIVSGSGVLSFAVAQNFESPADANADNVYEVIVAVSDGQGRTSQQTIRVTMTDVDDNTPVVPPNQQFSVSELANVGTVLGSVVATDADTIGTLQSWTITGGNTEGVFAVNPATGTITVADATWLDFETTSTYTLTVTVSDGTTVSAPQSIRIVVLDRNEAPVDLVLSGGAVAENSAGGTVVGTVTGSDPDAGDVLHYALINSGGGRFVIDATTGAIHVAAGALLNYEVTSSHIVTVRSTDSSGLTYDESFTISVRDANDAPVGTSDSYIALQIQKLNGVSGVLVNDHDEDGQRLTAILVSGPLYGSLVFNVDGTFQYQSTAVFSGLDSFRYRVSDGTLSSNIVTVTIDVRQALSSGIGSGIGSGSGGSGNSIGSTTTTTNSSGSSKSNSLPENTPPVTSPVAPAAVVNLLDPGLRTLNQDSQESGSVPGTTSNGVGLPDSVADALLNLTIFTDDVSLNRETPERSRSGSVTHVLTTLWNGSSVLIDPLDTVISGGEFIYRQFADTHDSEVAADMQEMTDLVVVGTTAVVSTSVSVGYVIWILRGGSLLTAFMSASPAWQSFDPLPILQSFDKMEFDDDETLLKIVTKKTVGPSLGKKRGINC